MNHIKIIPVSPKKAADIASPLGSANVIKNANTTEEK